MFPLVREGPIKPEQKQDRVSHTTRDPGPSPIIPSLEAGAWGPRGVVVFPSFQDYNVHFVTSKILVVYRQGMFVGVFPGKNTPCWGVF